LFGFAAGFIARSTGKLEFFSFILKGHLSQFLKTGFKPSGCGKAKYGERAKNPTDGPFSPLSCFYFLSKIVLSLPAREKF
jgi:hypothetical protein